MKLYFSPGACSFAPHIVLNELALSYTPVKVDLRSHKLEDGADFYAISPNGYVPILELDDGTRLAEAQVILQYLADRKPGTLGPAEAAGSIEHYRLIETLNFIATEIHKGFGPLWYPDTPEATKATTLAKLTKRFDRTAQMLGERQFIVGDTFTIADAYLFTILSWAGMLKVDLTPWPALQRYLERIGSRPSVQATKRVESSKARAAT